MTLSRRQFIATSTTTAATVAAAAAGSADDNVIEEVRRRKRFLSRPDGTPSEIEVAPSPPVRPFADRLYVPPVPLPLIDMTAHRELPDDQWWETFAEEFREIRTLLVNEEQIDIGDLPVADAHQRFWDFRPVKFYLLRELEFGWAYHSDYCGDYLTCLAAAGTSQEKSYMPEGYKVAPGLPPSDAERAGLSWTWGFETIGLDAGGNIVRRLSSPGPTFHAYYDEPILVRRMNELSEIGPTDGNARLRFALPSTTTHLHNAHTASESDGFPSDWINPGEYWDHHYGNFPSGNDEREKLATLWYHDHRMDFTAANVYAGLDGFYFLFDQKDANDETNEDSWQLPSGDNDIPLIFHDLYFQPEANGGQETPQLIFDGFNTDGVLGDRFTVNRIIQPHLEVEARKYRFRLLNGGPSRFYEFALYDETGAKIEPDNGAFIVITGDGNFQPNPILVKSIYLGVAQRVDVIIDFSTFKGESLYLVNQLEQINGRGPTERRLESEGDDASANQAFLDQNSVLRFDIGDEDVDDPSKIPLLFREFPPIDLTEVKRERIWEFDYDGGLWTINGKTYDPNRIDAGIEQDSAEIWTFRNTGNSWHHPIHSHFTEFMVLEVNGRPHYQANRSGR